MILEIFLIGLATLLLYIHWKQNYSEFSKKLNEFPGEKIIPILGNILEMQVSTDQIFDVFRKNYRKFRDTYRVWSGHVGMLNVTTAEDFEIILTSNVHIKKSLIYEFLHGWLGTGLLTSTGAKWQKRRKLLTPAFHFNILRRFVEIFGEHSMKLVEDLKKECDKPKTNVTPYITHTTLQVICETAMGTTLDSKNEIQRNYLQALYDIADSTMNRMVQPWLYNNFIFNILPSGWNFRKYVKHLHLFTNTVIREREANFKCSDVENLEKDENDDGTKKKRLAMLDLLLSAKKIKRAIDHDGLREEVDTFMFEGHDTTSVGLSLALFLLAKHKDIQDKIFIELDEIFGEDRKRPANYDDLQKMPYLEMCLKESLRIFPSVPIIGRKLEQDLQLSKHVAPAGVAINLQIFDLHRDPVVFPEPEKFDPERFSPENVKGRHPFAYVPFSAGPRNCIGQKFALLEMKSVISAILRNYELEAVGEETIENRRFIVDFVLRAATPIDIKFKPRFQ